MMMSYNKKSFFIKKFIEVIFIIREIDFLVRLQFQFALTLYDIMMFSFSPFSFVIIVSCKLRKTENRFIV